MATDIAACHKTTRKYKKWQMIRFVFQNLTQVIVEVSQEYEKRNYIVLGLYPSFAFFLLWVKYDTDDLYCN